jgi:hypothetical protein
MTSGASKSLSKWFDIIARLYDKLRPAILIVALVILAAGSVYVFLWATGPHGIGVRTDSVEYLWGSENLAKGIGLGRLNGFGEFRAITHWPPLYPALLALPQLAGLNGLASARLLGALSLGLMVILLGLTIARLTHGSPWYTAFGTLVLLTSYALWNTSLYAMTEPLYMVLGLLAFLFLDSYLTTQKPVWLYSTAVLLALGLLTRYAAGAMVVAAVFALTLQAGQSLKKKVTDVLILGAIAVLPLALWMLRNLLLTDTATNRYVEFAPIPQDEWLRFGNLMAGWITPVLKLGEVNLPRIILILLVTVLMAWLLGRSHNSEKTVDSKLWLIYCLYAVSYFAYILFAKVLFDKTIPLGEERIFLPLYSSLAFLLIYGLYRLEIRLTNSYLRIALICVYVLVATGFVRGNVQPSAAYARLSNEKGLGLANQDVTGLESIPFIKALPEGPVIFTDDLEVLYFLTGRPSFQLNAINPDEIQKVKDALSKQGVYIVLFRKHDFGEQLRANIPQLETIYSANEVIYSGTRQP